MDMGLEDVCDTGLGLSLGYEGKSTLPKIDPPPLRSPVPLEPLLTLGLPDDICASTTVKKDTSKMRTDVQLARQSSTQSTISSFLNAYPSIVKRKKEIESEEAEGERASRISDGEEEGGSRKKLRLTKEQSALLEDNFKEHTTLNPKQKQALAKQLNLRTRQVEVWFQNRRARTKLKQTEMDLEFLKKCCEALTDENRRLQKEVQELRELKFAAPLYMQLPAAAVTACPSCKKIVGANDDSKRGPFMVAQKPHFLGPFANSAAC